MTKLQATITVGDQRIEEVHNDPNEPQEPTVITREFNGDVMTAVSSFNAYIKYQ